MLTNVCMEGEKIIDLASDHSFFHFVWFYALSVLGNFIRDSLLPNNGVDSFLHRNI